ncbi:MAG TPA: hypothetical protein VLN25_10695, partial [Burkholderiaceae bacterium]|nr:hypothetical protein [Burkholderiaceae bacterium]
MTRLLTPSPDDRFGIGAKLYCLWAATAIGVSLVLAGPTAETITRLLVLAFIAGQYVFRATLVNALPRLPPQARFITMGVLLAAVVEGFHMISKPVYSSLLVGPDTLPAEALWFYGIDLLVTTPAYIVIFAVIWFLINRFHYGLWSYIVVMGLGQALGDGGVFFFAAAPQMVVFLPYPMTNYHACNVLPFVATRDALPAARVAGRRAWLAVPVLIAVYLV